MECPKAASGQHDFDPYWELCTCCGLTVQDYEEMLIRDSEMENIKCECGTETDRHRYWCPKEAELKAKLPTS